jgi:hypothetical protein
MIRLPANHLFSPSNVMAVPTRKIADTQVTALGYGATGIAAFYGSVKPDEERFKVRTSPVCWS